MCLQEKEVRARDSLKARETAMPTESTYLGLLGLPWGWMPWMEFDFLTMASFKPPKIVARERVSSFPETKAQDESQFE